MNLFRSITVFIAMFLILAAPTVVTAGDGLSPWRFSAAIGKLDTEGDADVDDAYTASLLLDYALSPSLSIEASLTFVPTLEGNYYTDYSSGAPLQVNRLQEATGEDETSAAGAAVDALYYLAPGKSLNPYLSAGVGFLRYSEEIGENDGLDFTPRAGAGLLQRLTDSLSLRVDFRYFAAGTVTKSESNSRIDCGLAWTPGHRGTAQVPVTIIPVAAPEPPSAGTPRAEPLAAPETPPAQIVDRHELYIEFTGRNTAVEAQYFEQLDVIGRMLKDHPASTALIEGHCDQRRNDSEKEALELTRKRAEAVRDYLAGGKWKISRNRMETAGLGFSQPKEKADLDNGNTANRRIVISIRRPAIPVERE